MTLADSEDDRVRDTDTSVVQVTPSGGTGFIIGDNMIATAAHCVYNANTGSFVDNLQIVVRDIPYSNISREVKRCNVVEAHVPLSFMNAAITDDDTRSRYDYAIIYVEEDLSEYGIFDLGVPSTEFMGTNTGITISGFPSETASNPSAGNMALYKDTGVIKDISIRDNTIVNHRIMSTAYASGGNSGGPVYMTSTFGGEEYRTVIGIHTSSGYCDYDSDGVEERVALGTRITPSLLRFYFNNEYIGNTENY